MVPPLSAVVVVTFIITPFVTTVGMLVSVVPVVEDFLQPVPDKAINKTNDGKNNMRSKGFFMQKNQ